MMNFCKLIFFLPILLGWGVAECVLATDVYFAATGTNAWETASNWSPATVPSIAGASIARITNGATVEITQAGQNAQQILLVQNVGQTGNMHLKSGTLETSQDQNLCKSGVASFTQEEGSTNQSGGTLTIAQDSGSRGTYRLNGGVLNVPNNDINIGYNAGATGTFEQVGGVLASTGGNTKYLYLGRSAGSVGSYVMNGGSILLTSTNYGSIGNSGVGHFTQNNGTVVVDKNFNIGKEIGGYGDYTLNNGSFLAYWPVLGEKSGATGVVTVTGGVFQGGNKFSVGLAGRGSMYQSGGMVGVTNQSLFLGENASGVGTYMLSGAGKLLLTNAANYLYVGNYGNGTFVQSNGTVAVTNYLIVGRYTNAVGLYRIEKGDLSVGQNLIMGESVLATGTLQVVGSASTINVKNYQQNASSRLEIEFDGSGVSPINVSGNAVVDGVLKITGHENFGYNSTVTVINATSLSGVFSSTNLVPPLIRADVIYDVANGDVKLTHFKYVDKGLFVIIN